MLLFFAAIEDDIIRSKLETIYEMFSSAMFKKAYFYLKNDSDAEDAVHEAFIKLYRYVGDIDDAKSAKTKSFSLIITEHCAIDILRRRLRRNEVELEENIFSCTDEYQYEGENRVVSLIFQLDYKYRNVLLLRYAHEMGYSEIARLMNMAPDNARKICQRARTKLEQLCNEQGLL